jgi:transcriptional repressor NrdR
MVCIFCLHNSTRVYNSRKGTKLNTIWRRRRCDNCGAEFTTYESADVSAILTVQHNKNVEPFSHTRLLLELLQVLGHLDKTDEIVPYTAGTIEQKLFRIAATNQKHSVTPQEVIKVTAEVLEHYDTTAYLTYAARHKLINDSRIRKALNKK